MGGKLAREPSGLVRIVGYLLLLPVREIGKRARLREHVPEDFRVLKCGVSSTETTVARSGHDHSRGITADAVFLPAPRDELICEEIGKWIGANQVAVARP